MINRLRKGIKFSMQKVYFRKVIFNVDPSFKCIEKFKSLTFQLRAIWFHTFTVDATVSTLLVHEDIHTKIFA